MAQAVMDVRKAVQSYITKMMNDVPEMKVMLLDAETTQCVSMVFSQTEILQKEVFLVEKLSKHNRDKMQHMKCIVFVRPTQSNIQQLVDELREPKYGSYHIYFTNIVRMVYVEQLAQADQHSLVKDVQEYYGDFLAVHHDLFSLDIPTIYGETAQSWEPASLERSAEGLISICLALKKRPGIRYDRASPMAQRLAKEVEYTVSQESALFENRMVDNTAQLIILDRRCDPVTPLLNQWTYEAMIHELFTIKYNVVDMSARVEKGNKNDKELAAASQLMLSADMDPFFQKNMYMNMGDLGANLKKFVDEYQERHQKTTKIDSIEDMKRFVQDFPDFRRLSGNVSKHVTLLSELSRVMDKEGLMSLSEVEQELACSEDHSAAVRNVFGILNDPRINEFNKARVVLLYALRYERSQQNELSSMFDKLNSAAIDRKLLAALQGILRYAGNAVRQNDLFQNDSLLARSKAALKMGLKGVDNIYTQHVPYFVRLIELLVKGRLKPEQLPFIDNRPRDRVQDIILFFVGGVTYEEARFVAQLNDENKGYRIILGGTSVINSNAFLDQIVTGAAKTRV